MLEITGRNENRGQAWAVEGESVSTGEEGREKWREREVVREESVGSSGSRSWQMDGWMQLRY